MLTSLEAITEAIALAGGPSEVGRQLGETRQTVSNWQRRGAPAERIPDLERLAHGRVPCERMRTDLVWGRIPDKAWRWHKKGRPVLDVTKAVA